MIYDDLPLEHGDFPVQKPLNNQRVRHQNQHFVGRPSHPRPPIPSRVVSITPPKPPLSRPSHLELGGQAWLTVRIFGLCMVFSYLTLFNNRFPNGSVIIVLPTLFIIILVSMTSFSISSWKEHLGRSTVDTFQYLDVTESQGWCCSATTRSSSIQTTKSIWRTRSDRTWVGFRLIYMFYYMGVSINGGSPK